MKSFAKKRKCVKKFEPRRGAAATPAPLVHPPMDPSMEVGLLHPPQLGMARALHVLIRIPIHHQ